MPRAAKLQSTGSNRQYTNRSNALLTCRSTDTKSSVATTFVKNHQSPTARHALSQTSTSSLKSSENLISASTCSSIDSSRGSAVSTSQTAYTTALESHESSPSTANPSSPSTCFLSANGHAIGISPSPAALAMNKLTTSTATSLAASGYIRNPALPHPTQLDDHRSESESGNPAHAHMIALRRGSVGTGSEISSSDLYGPSDSAHRSIDVNAMKNSDVHCDSGSASSMDPTSTVVSSFPLADTVAMLMILLHLPPTALFLIYFTFTFLAYIPPVTTFSGMSVNIAELLEASVSKPSPTAMFFDGIVLIIWLFLWSPLQDFIVDITKVVISVTLGAGTRSTSPRLSPTSSPTSSAPSHEGFFICIFILSIKHIIDLTKRLWAPTISKAFPSVVSLPDFLNPSIEKPPITPRGIVGWAQVILAVHILMQGAIKFVKGWYLRRELNGPMSSSSTPAPAGPASGSNDPEAGARSFQDQGETSSNDPETATAASDGTSTLSSSHNKRRKRQNAPSRFRQPLWSALASTKIIMAKEFELIRVASEMSDTHALGKDELGNAPFTSQPSQIWITFIGSDEVCFSTSFFDYIPPSDSTISLPNSQAGSTSLNHDNNSTNTNSTNSTSSHGNTGSGEQSSGDFIDKSKPFYVEINNAQWPSVTIVPARNQEPLSPMIPDDEATLPSMNTPSILPTGDAKSSQKRWCGSIYSLRPVGKYVVDFRDCKTRELLYTTTIMTRPEVSRRKNQAKGIPQCSTNVPAVPHLRPDSPVTTLSLSITDQEKRLKEARLQHKSNRKDWKSRLQSLKRELDNADASINSSNDDRTQQKIRAQQTAENQVRQESVELDRQLVELGSGPATLNRDKAQAEEEFKKEKRLHAAAQAAMHDYRSLLEKKLKEKQDTQKNLSNKQSKMLARISKLSSELASVKNAMDATETEIKRKVSDHEDFMNECYKRRTSLQAILRSAQSQVEAYKLQLLEAQNSYTYMLAQGSQQPMASGVPNPLAQMGHVYPVDGHDNSASHVNGYVTANGASAYGASLHTQAYDMGMSSHSSCLPTPPGLYPPGTVATPATTISSAPWSSAFGGNSVWTTATSDTTAGYISLTIGPPSVSIVAPAMLGAQANTWGTRFASLSAAAKARGRSSSMLSELSGLTQSTGAEDPMGSGSSDSTSSPDGLSKC